MPVSRRALMRVSAGTVSADWELDASAELTGIASALRCVNATLLETDHNGVPTNRKLNRKTIRPTLSSLMDLMEFYTFESFEKFQPFDVYNLSGFHYFGTFP